LHQTDIQLSIRASVDTGQRRLRDRFWYWQVREPLPRRRIESRNIRRSLY